MSLTTENIFDANFYRDANPDLAYTTDAQALSHFQTYGLNEGRMFSPLIDLNFYKASNPDLAKMTNSQLLSHLKNHGVAEGRAFSPLVDLSYYRGRYGDINKFSNEQLFSHLKNSGISEGRFFNPLFTLGQYRRFNSDLAQMNNSQLLSHLIIHGINEGRQFSYYFDSKYYSSNNKDLAGYNHNQRLQHYEIYGINEGRKSSPNFDAGYYKANNPDLFGFKGINLLEHFDKHGIFEGRQSATDYAGDTLYTARQLTLSPNYSGILEHVGSSDPNDYYRFDLSATSTVNIINSYGFSKNISNRLLNGSGQLVKSLNSQQYNSDNSTVGTANNSILLNPGTYYINIQPLAGNTDYQFDINATTPQPVTISQSPSASPSYQDQLFALFVANEQAKQNELLGSILSGYSPSKFV
jgi:hypothetical protein